MSEVVMSDTVVEIKNLKKCYQLGQYNGDTFSHEVQSWWAKKHGKEDPNRKLVEEAPVSDTTFWALNGINLNIQRGEVLGIIGRNGSGKSTLLKMLCRITAPTEGSIKFKGRIACMLEVGTGFNPEMTGRENIYLNGSILGMSREEVDSKLEDIIEFSECREFIDTPVKRYSSGMYVKLAFSVAAHLDSDILIMDEVLAVGDIAFQSKCLKKMNEAATNESRTVLFVTHNMSMLRSLCTRCLVLTKGKISFDGDVDEAIYAYTSSIEQEQAAKDKALAAKMEETAKIDAEAAAQRSAAEQEAANQAAAEAMQKEAEQKRLEKEKAKRLFALKHTFASPDAPASEKRVILYSVEILNKDTTDYTAGEPIQFKISWKANAPANYLMLRVVIHNSDFAQVAMACSNHFECVGEEIQEMTFSLDSAILIEDKYSCDLYLGQNEDGDVQIFDMHKSAFGFVITENENQKGIVWAPASWGNVVLPALKQIP